jgi:hypothetical protein
VPSSTVADDFAEPGSAQPFPEKERDVILGTLSGANSVASTGEAMIAAGARAARRSVEVLKYILVRDVTRRVLYLSFAGNNMVANLFRE